MSLLGRIASVEAQIQHLRDQLSSLETHLGSLRQLAANEGEEPCPDGGNAQPPRDQSRLHEHASPPTGAAKESLAAAVKWPLRHAEYKRYGRQVIMPEVGLHGQLQLKSAAVLIIGAGGLGCPAAAYLAGAGVGKIGLVDGDVVEESNLHRQVLHSTGRVGWRKVESAIKFLIDLNPLVEYVPHPTRLTPENAVELVGAYDVVLDCTDTPASRYLISDTCVILKKPLVSASALRTEGQLMVLNQPPRPAGYHEGGPCYRCVFPKPPPAETVVSCGDGGILGPVVGVMGVLQALEAIKLITSAETSESTASPTLLLFSAYSTPQFRSIRLRRRKANCAACSATATVTKESLLSGSMDYVQFCGIADPVNLLAPDERITATEYAMKRGKQGVLIDVREKVQFDLCSLEGSMNIPFSEVVALNQEPSQEVEEPTKSMKRLKTVLENQESGIPIYVICRLGNDSQVAVKRLKQLGLGSNETRWVGDVKGGLRSWREEVDPEFPDY